MPPLWSPHKSRVWPSGGESFRQCPPPPLGTTSNGREQYCNWNWVAWMAVHRYRSCGGLLWKTLLESPLNFRLLPIQLCGGLMPCRTIIPIGSGWMDAKSLISALKMPQCTIMLICPTIPFFRHSGKERSLWEQWMTKHEVGEALNFHLQHQFSLVLCCNRFQTVPSSYECTQ